MIVVVGWIIAATCTFASRCVCRDPSTGGEVSDRVVAATAPCPVASRDKRLTTTDGARRSAGRSAPTNETLGNRTIDVAARVVCPAGKAPTGSTGELSMEAGA